MNREEQVVVEYLKTLYGENVAPVLAHKDPPDIVVNSSIAVEVRRLNQNFFESRKPEGLESLSFPLESAFEEVLSSLNYLYTNKSYWVFIHYARPLNTSIQQAKKDIDLALRNFLSTKVDAFPCEISVSSKIILSIYASNLSNGHLFSFGGGGDFDAGGWVIPVYIENIRHCIKEKSTKIEKQPRKYQEWWLYLVDCLRLGLKSQKSLEVVKEVGNTGAFDKVVILNYEGDTILATLSRKGLTDAAP